MRAFQKHIKHRQINDYRFNDNLEVKIDSSKMFLHYVDFLR